MKEHRLIRLAGVFSLSLLLAAPAASPAFADILMVEDPYASASGSGLSADSEGFISGAICETCADTDGASSDTGGASSSGTGGASSSDTNAGGGGAEYSSGAETAAPEQAGGEGTSSADNAAAPEAVNDAGNAASSGEIGPGVANAVTEPAAEAEPGTPGGSEPIETETDPRAIIERGEKGAYLGNFVTTGYDNPNGQPTASGLMPVENHTVATDWSVIPKGTKIRFADSDIVYTVDDCGVHGKWVDVYYEDHDVAWSHGLVYKDVYLVDTAD